MSKLRVRKNLYGSNSSLQELFTTLVISSNTPRKQQSRQQHISGGSSSGQQQQLLEDLTTLRSEEQNEAFERLGMKKHSQMRNRRAVSENYQQKDNRIFQKQNNAKMKNQTIKMAFKKNKIYSGDTLQYINKLQSNQKVFIKKISNFNNFRHILERLSPRNEDVSFLFQLRDMNFRGKNKKQSTAIPPRCYTDVSPSAKRVSDVEMPKRDQHLYAHLLAQPKGGANTLTSSILNYEVNLRNYSPKQQQNTQGSNEQNNNNNNNNNAVQGSTLQLKEDGWKKYQVPTSKVSTVTRFVPSGYRKRRKTNGDETVSKMHAHTRLCRNTVQERMMVSQYDGYQNFPQFDGKIVAENCNLLRCLQRNLNGLKNDLPTLKWELSMRAYQNQTQTQQQALSEAFSRKTLNRLDQQSLPPLTAPAARQSSAVARSK